MRRGRSAEAMERLAFRVLDHWVKRAVCQPRCNPAEFSGPIPARTCHVSPASARIWPMRALVQRVSRASVTVGRRGHGSDRPGPVRAGRASPTPTGPTRPGPWPPSSGTSGCSTAPTAGPTWPSARSAARCWWSRQFTLYGDTRKGRRPVVDRRRAARAGRAAGRRRRATSCVRSAPRSPPAASAPTWPSSSSTTAPSPSCSRSTRPRPPDSTGRPRLSAPTRRPVSGSARHRGARTRSAGRAAGRQPGEEPGGGEEDEPRRATGCRPSGCTR